MEKYTDCASGHVATDTTGTTVKVSPIRHDKTGGAGLNWGADSSKEHSQQTPGWRGGPLKKRDVRLTIGNTSPD